jgi:hypothetical protein
MARFHFDPLNRPDAFDIYFEGKVIGAVWHEDGQWHAHPFSLAAPLVSAESRQEAAELLVQNRGGEEEGG